MKKTITWAWLKNKGACQESITAWGRETDHGTLDLRPRKAIDAAKAYLKKPSRKTKDAAAYAAAYAAASAAASAAYASASAAADAASAAYASASAALKEKIIRYCANYSARTYARRYEIRRGK